MRQNKNWRQELPKKPLSLPLIIQSQQVCMNNFVIIYVLLFWIKLAYSIMKTCPFSIYHEICLIRCALGKGSYLRISQCLSRSSFSAVFLIPSLISALTLCVSESPRPQHAWWTWEDTLWMSRTALWRLKAVCICISFSSTLCFRPFYHYLAWHI